MFLGTEERLHVPSQGTWPQYDIQGYLRKKGVDSSRALEIENVNENKGRLS